MGRRNVVDDDTEMEEDLHGKKEKHEMKFTGWWIPAEVVHLYLKKKISAKELILLATIDCLIDRETGMGCYASNGYLAKRLHYKLVRNVQFMLAKLRYMGLIRVVEDDKKRFLYTSWYKPPQRRKRGV